MQNKDQRISQNVRYLLWKRKVARESWSSWLASRSDLDELRANALVRGDLLDREFATQQVEQLCHAFGFNEAEQELRFRDLVMEEVDVLLENLKHLIDGMERGGKKELAVALNVDPTTVSRWLNGSYEPHKTTLGGIARYFGLPHDVDLMTDPIFLAAAPLALKEQKRWIYRRIEEMGLEDFRSLYPAFCRILEER